MRLSGCAGGLDVTKEELQEQIIHFFSIEKGMKIISWGQGFSYTRE
jgi:hypothetical protein